MTSIDVYVVAVGSKSTSDFVDPLFGTARDEEIYSITHKTDIHIVL